MQDFVSNSPEVSYFSTLLPPFFLHCVIKYICAELNFFYAEHNKNLPRPSFSDCLSSSLSSFPVLSVFPRVLCTNFCYSQQGPKNFILLNCHYTLGILEKLLDKGGCFEGVCLCSYLYECVYNLCFVNYSSNADRVKKVSA